MPTSDTNPPPSSDPVPVPAPPSRRLAGVLIILCATLAVYLPSLKGGFIWDDAIMLTGNEMVKASRGLWDMWFCTRVGDGYFPLTWSAFWLQWRVWGMHPEGYRLVNLLLHAGSALLLWRVLTRLQAPGGWLAGILFALHPVCVMSVAWISELKNTLSLFLALLCLLPFAAWLESGRNRVLPAAEGEVPTEEQGKARCDLSVVPASATLLPWFRFRAPLVLCTLLFLLSLLAKPLAIGLPVFLLFFLWWKDGRATVANMLPLAPLFAAALAIGLVTPHFQNAGAEHLAWQEPLFLERLLLAAKAYWFYWGQTLYPAGLTLCYAPWRLPPGDWLSWLPLAALAVMLAGGWLLRRRIGTLPLLLLAAHGLMLAPTLGLAGMTWHRYAWVSDHFNYGGLAVAAAAGGMLAAQTIRRFQDSARLRLVAPVVCGGGLLLLASATLFRADLFGDPIVLWRHNTVVCPESWGGWEHLSCALLDAGRPPEAEAAARASLKLQPNPAAQYELAFALHQQGRLNEAIAEYRHALRLEPDAPAPYWNYGLALNLAGKTEEAVRMLRRSLELQPDNPAVRADYARLLANAGRRAEALLEFRRAVRDGSTDSVTWEQHADLLLTLHPDDPQARREAESLLRHAAKLRQATGASASARP